MTLRNIFVLLPVISLLPFICGCALLPTTTPTGVATELPDNPEALTLLADRTYNYLGPSRDVRLSYEAARKNLATNPLSETANFQAARAAAWLMEFGAIADKAVAEFGYYCAKILLGLNSGRGEYQYLAGALLGFKLQTSIVPNLDDLKQVNQYFTEAVQMNAAYDNGAPLRALGTLLVRAPAWPVSVGDLESGIEYLERAANEFPVFPANHLYLAEAYCEAGRNEDARQSLAHCRRLLTEADWGEPGEMWLHQAEALAAKLSE